MPSEEDESVQAVCNLLSNRRRPLQLHHPTSAPHTEPVTMALPANEAKPTLLDDEIDTLDKSAVTGASPATTSISESGTSLTPPLSILHGTLIALRFFLLLQPRPQHSSLWTFDQTRIRST